MILTPEERRALLGLLSLLVLGQGAALLRDERKARPDRELSAWLTRAQVARAESLGVGADLADGWRGAMPAAVASATSGTMPGTTPGAMPGVTTGATSRNPADGKFIAAHRSDETGETAFDGAVAESTASPPGAKALEAVPIEPASSIPAGVAATGRIAINRASALDLEALPGIGPALAKRIVEEREKAGPFRSPRDLLRVKGIGPKKQAAIQERIDWAL
jgi:competence ComEA-like helix-hairpin-helix protein